MPNKFPFLDFLPKLQIKQLLFDKGHTITNTILPINEGIDYTQEINELLIQINKAENKSNYKQAEAVDYEEKYVIDTTEASALYNHKPHAPNNVKPPATTSKLIAPISANPSTSTALDRLRINRSGVERARKFLQQKNKKLQQAKKKQTTSKQENANSNNDESNQDHTNLANIDSKDNNNRSAAENQEKVQNVELGANITAQPNETTPEILEEPSGKQPRKRQRKTELEKLQEVR
jgi:hypothetical protein